MTYSDTRWRPAPGTQPSLGGAPATHTTPPLHSHPHSGRSRAPAALPRSARGAALLFRSLPAPGPQRAGRDELTPPPAGLPGLTRSRCRRPGRERGPRAPPAGSGGRLGAHRPPGRGGPQAPRPRSEPPRVGVGGGCPAGSRVLSRPPAHAPPPRSAPLSCAVCFPRPPPRPRPTPRGAPPPPARLPGTPGPPAR